MHRNDRDREKWPEDIEPEQNRRSRPNSRRNSTSSSVSRRNSLKKDTTERTRKQTQKSPLNSSTPNSTNSTPKRTCQKREVPQNLDFLVTGKQIFKKTDRANSLPLAYHRRPSADSLLNSKPRSKNEAKKNNSTSSKSRETSLEDDMSLELSQVSDFEDVHSKYGIPKKFGIATSTPKSGPKTFQKPRSGSLQSQKSKILEQPKKNQKSLDSSKRGSNFTCSRDSLYKTSSTASPYGGRRSTELDYSSVSPEYSGASSGDGLSPTHSVLYSDVAVLSPYSQRSQLSGSSCYLSWVESAEADKTKTEKKQNENGEWNNFWANYNNSISRVPIKNYYDQCPTPYRTENIELTDLDINPDDPMRPAPDLKNINNIIRNEGLQLTPRETQNIIKCAHILGNVLSKAIDRRAKEADFVVQKKVEEIDPVAVDEENAEDKDIKKRNLKLELKEQNKPLENEVKERETVTTQTDISLPNTKSAPKIFENILRQLSRSSMDETVDIEKKLDKIEIDINEEN